MTSPELSHMSLGPFGSTLKSGIAPHLAASAGPDRAIAPIRAPVTAATAILVPSFGYRVPLVSRCAADSAHRVGARHRHHLNGCQCAASPKACGWWQRWGHSGRQAHGQLTVMPVAAFEPVISRVVAPVEDAGRAVVAVDHSPIVAPGYDSRSRGAAGRPGRGAPGAREPAVSGKRTRRESPEVPSRSSS